jgi:hypothetical protein
VQCFFPGLSFESALVLGLAFLRACEGTSTSSLLLGRLRSLVLDDDDDRKAMERSTIVRKKIAKERDLLIIQPWVSRCFFNPQSSNCCLCVLMSGPPNSFNKACSNRYCIYLLSWRLRWIDDGRISLTTDSSLIAPILTILRSRSSLSRFLF